MITGVAAVVGCRATRGMWSTAQWIPESTWWIVFVWSFALPMLILPVGVAGLARDEDTIRVDTVLGPRVLSRATLKSSWVRVAISAYDLDVALLRDSRHCPALITRVQAAPPPARWRSELTPGSWRTLARETASRLKPFAVALLIWVSWVVASIAVAAGAVAVAGIPM